MPLIIALLLIAAASMEPLFIALLLFKLIGLTTLPWLYVLAPFFAGLALSSAATAVVGFYLVAVRIRDRATLGPRTVRAYRGSYDRRRGWRRVAVALGLGALLSGCALVPLIPVIATGISTALSGAQTVEGIVKGITEQAQQSATITATAITTVSSDLAAVQADDTAISAATAAGTLTQAQVTKLSTDTLALLKDAAPYFTAIPNATTSTSASAVAAPFDSDAFVDSQPARPTALFRR